MNAAFCTSILLSLVVVCAVTNPVLRPEKLFPIYERDELTIEILTNTSDLSLYAIVVFHVELFSRSIADLRVLYVGFLKFHRDRLFNKYFIVKSYTSQPQSIKILVKFYRPSDGLRFVVTFVNATNEKMRKDVIDNIHKYSAYQLTNHIVSLWLHWTLKITQTTPDHYRNGFHNGTVGIICCNATGGRPFSQAQLLGVDELQDGKSTKMQPNAVMFKFISRLEDHGKVIQCRAGNDVVNDQIRVFHHVTKIRFIPEVYGYVKNGSKVVCESENGYPKPQERWSFQSGPLGAAKFYKINNSDTGNAAELFMLSTAPIGSEWVFSCMAANTIPNSINKTFVRTVKFRIGEAPIPIILIVSLVVGIFVFILIVSLLIYAIVSGRCSRKKRHIQDIPEKSKKPFQLKETSSCSDSTVFIPEIGTCDKHNPIDAV